MWKRMSPKWSTHIVKGRRSRTRLILQEVASDGGVIEARWRPAAGLRQSHQGQEQRRAEEKRAICHWRLSKRHCYSAEDVTEGSGGDKRSSVNTKQQALCVCHDITQVPTWESQYCIVWAAARGSCASRRGGGLAMEWPWSGWEETTSNHFLTLRRCDAKAMARCLDAADRWEQSFARMLWRREAIRRIANHVHATWRGRAYALRPKVWRQNSIAFSFFIFPFSFFMIGWILDFKNQPTSLLSSFSCLKFATGTMSLKGVPSRLGTMFKTCLKHVSN